jgi:Concanavalin A-like lectin/glucanases superfamily
MPFYLGGRRSLLSQTIGGTLSIVGGNISALIHGGQSQLVLQDQYGRVVGADAWTTSNSSNVTVTSAGLLQGAAESGSATITAAKAGYVSASITVTCSGNLYSLDPNTLSQTNGQNVTSITDSGSVAWTNSVTPPTCYQDATSGRRALLFNGTTQYLQAASHISAFEGTALSLFMVVAPVQQGDFQILIAGTTLGTTGWSQYIYTDNKYYCAVATAFTGIGGGSVIPTSGFSRVGFTIASAAQSAYVNGINTGSATQTYTNGTQSAGPVLAAATTGGVDSFGGYLGLMLSYNRVITSTEIAQVDLRLANEAAALVA